MEQQQGEPDVHRTRRVVVLIDINSVHENPRLIDFVLLRLLMFLGWEDENEKKRDQVMWGYRFFDGRADLGCTSRELDRVLNSQGKQHMSFTFYVKRFDVKSFKRFSTSAKDTLKRWQAIQESNLDMVLGTSRLSKSVIIQRTVQESVNEFTWDEGDAIMRKGMSNQNLPGPLESGGNAVFVFAHCPQTVDELVRDFGGDTNGKTNSERRVGQSFSFFHAIRNRMRKSGIAPPGLFWVDTCVDPKLRNCPGLDMLSRILQRVAGGNAITMGSIWALGNVMSIKDVLWANFNQESAEILSNQSLGTPIKFPTPTSGASLTTTTPPRVMVTSPVFMASPIASKKTFQVHRQLLPGELHGCIGEITIEGIGAKIPVQLSGISCGDCNTFRIPTSFKYCHGTTDLEVTTQKKPSGTTTRIRLEEQPTSEKRRCSARLNSQTTPPTNAEPGKVLDTVMPKIQCRGAIAFKDIPSEYFDANETFVMQPLGNHEGFEMVGHWMRTSKFSLVLDLECRLGVQVEILALFLSPGNWLVIPLPGLRDLFKGATSDANGVITNEREIITSSISNHEHLRWRNGNSTWLQEISTTAGTQELRHLYSCSLKKGETEEIAKAIAAIREKGKEQIARIERERGENTRVSGSSIKKAKRNKLSPRKDLVSDETSSLLESLRRSYDESVRSSKDGNDDNTSVHRFIDDALTSVNKTLLGMESGSAGMSMADALRKFVRKKMLFKSDASYGKNESLGDIQLIQHYKLQVVLRLYLGANRDPTKDPISKPLRSSIKDYLRLTSFSITGQQNGARKFREFVEECIIGVFSDRLPKTTTSLYKSLFDEDPPRSQAKVEAEEPHEKPFVENKPAIPKSTTKPPKEETKKLKRRHSSYNVAAVIKETKQENLLTKKKVAFNHFTHRMSNMGALFREVSIKKPPLKRKRSAGETETGGHTIQATPIKRSRSWEENPVVVKETPQSKLPDENPTCKAPSFRKIDLENTNATTTRNMAAPFRQVSINEQPLERKNELENDIKLEGAIRIQPTPVRRSRSWEENPVIVTETPQSRLPDRKNQTREPSSFRKIDLDDSK